MNDLASTITALTRQARDDGSKTISCDAIDHAIANHQDPPPDHRIIIAVDGNWMVAHPRGCNDTYCSVANAVRRSQLVADRHLRGGTYVAWFDGDQLRFKEILAGAS